MQLVFLANVSLPTAPSCDAEASAKAQVARLPGEGALDVSVLAAPFNLLTFQLFNFSMVQHFNEFVILIPQIYLFVMKPNIDNKGRAARGGIAAIFLLAGGSLIWEAPMLAVIFILVGLFCAFEAWQAWCAIRACGFKFPF